MRKPLRNILYIASNEPLFSGGILWMQSINILKEIKETHQEIGVTFLYFYPLIHRLKHRRQFQALRRHFESMNIRLRLYPVPFRGLWLNALLILPYLLWTLPFLALILISEKPDIIHCRSYPASVLGLIATKISGGHLIFDMRGLFVEEGQLKKKSWAKGTVNNKAWKSIECRLLRRASTVIVVSQQFANIIKPRVHGNLRIIPCCYSPNQKFGTVDYQRPCEVAQADGFSLVYSGSIGGWFSLDNLLDFFLLIKKEINTASLEILSYGFNQELLVSAARRRGLKNGVISIDSVDHRFVVERLARHRAGLLIRYDNIVNHVGFPVKVAEYLAAGLPIITTSASKAIADFAEANQVGIVIDPTDMRSLKTKLADLTTNIHTYRQNALAISRFFSPEYVAKLYYQAYVEEGNIPAGDHTAAGL